MKPRVVMKFGGTSVGSIDRIKAVAKRVAKHVKETGENVCVVVSAMSGETDRLLGLGRQIKDASDSREFAQLVTSGEQVSSALVAMALKEEGIKSRSLIAYQLHLRTKNYFGHDLISEIDVDRILTLFEQDEVPVVAGFQGLNHRDELTTLGRGGSDTTAVAIAALLGPCPCHILTDVDGVYTGSPKVCPQARKLEHLTYEEMLELARSGAKVLQTRSVSLAQRFKVPLVVASSFDDVPGTEIIEEYPEMENAVVSGITHKPGEAKLTLWNTPDAPGVAGTIFRAIADANVSVDMIVQSQGFDGKTAISFTVESEDVDKAFRVLKDICEEKFPVIEIHCDRNIAKLSIVGEGMRNHSGVAAQVFEVLGKEEINVEMITTSEIKISLALKENIAESAVRALHSYFIEEENSKR